MYLLSLSNGAVLNAYVFGEFTSEDAEISDKNDKFEEKGKRSRSIRLKQTNARKFIRMSSLLTFGHHAIVLSSIMILATINPEYFDQNQYKDLALRPDGCHFFWVFGVTLLMGVYSTVLSLYHAKNVAIVNSGKLEL